MSHLIKNIIERPLVAFSQDISTYISKENQKIAAIGALALAGLAAFYLLLRCCFFQRTANVIEPSPDPKDGKVTASPRQQQKVERVDDSEKRNAAAVDGPAPDVKETDHARLLEQAVQDNLELQEENRKLQQEVEKVQKLLKLETGDSDTQIGNFRDEIQRLQDERDDKTRQIDKLATELRQEKEISSRQAGDLLKLQGIINNFKLQPAAKVAPEASSITPKPMRYVFVAKDDDDSSTEDIKHAFKEFVAQSGVPQCEFLSLSAATVKRRKLQKELDEGTVTLCSVSFITETSSLKNCKHMKAVDALYDPNKTMVVFLLNHSVSYDEKLMPSTIFAQASDGTKLSRVVSLPFRYDSQFKKQILEDSKAALGKLKDKAELLHELHDV